MSTETLVKSSSSSFLSHFVVDTPSAGGRLTPNFFNSIFNDGMNPFDESFTATTAASPGLGSSAAILESANTFTKMKPSPLSNDKISVMLPSIETHYKPESDLLRRRPMSPLSPPISPDDPEIVTRSPILSNTRSPSPFTHSNPFMSTPSPSTSPITSPDEPKSSNATPVIKQEEQSPSALPITQSRRRTICAVDSRKVETSQDTSKKTEKAASATRHKSLPNSGEPEAKQNKGRAKSASQNAAAPKTGKSGARAASKQILGEEVPAPKPTAGRKRKRVEVEPKPEEEEEEDEEQKDDLLNDDDPNSAHKRARFLERNRIAASKCRKKKKLMNQRLEERSRMLHQHNRYLNQLVSSLKSDVLRLKQCLLVHHDCEDEPIKRYLQCEAGKVFNPQEKMDKILAPPILKSEPKVPASRMDDLNDNWSGLAARNRDFDAEFHSFQEVESAALGRMGKGSDLSYEDEMSMLFGDEMEI